MHLVHVEAHQDAAQHLAQLGVHGDSTVAPDGDTSQETPCDSAQWRQSILQGVGHAEGVAHVIDERERMTGHHLESTRQSRVTGKPSLDARRVCPGDQRSRRGQRSVGQHVRAQQRVGDGDDGLGAAGQPGELGAEVQRVVGDSHHRPG